MTAILADSTAAQLRPDEAEAEGFAAVASAVRAGLTRRRKRLPPWLLYDQRGSALFERITQLPEYYLTRTERGILAAEAAAMIEAAGPPLEVIELGAGSATKTRLLLEALLDRQPRATYVPVDVSPAALRLAAAELRGLARLQVRPVVARYPEALGFLRRPSTDLGTRARRLVLFLGSNVGNYDLPEARALLAGVRRHLGPGDALLMGVDRRKAPELVLPAYDDAAGVTAAFNKNLLARLNRELGAAFDLTRFRHVVDWNDRASRVELFLESTVAQQVPLPALGLAVTFRARERLHTESSHKLTETRVRRLLAASGFVPEATWSDEGGWYGLHLGRVPAPPAPKAPL